MPPSKIDDHQAEPPRPESEPIGTPAGPPEEGSPRPPLRRRSTFNLLQLLVGLGLVALLSAVAIPAWFARPAVTLERAAVLLAEDLREAQNRAAFGHRSVEVVFFPGGDGYEVRDDSGRPLAARVGEGPFRREYSRDAVFRGVRLSILDGVAAGSIFYDRLGFLVEAARIEVHYQDRQVVLSLEERSGHIKMTGTPVAWLDDGN